MLAPRLHPDRVVERVCRQAVPAEQMSALEGHRPTAEWFDYVSQAPVSERGIREDGTLLFVVLRGCLSAGALDQARRGLVGLRAAPLNRGSATGRDGRGRTLKAYPAILQPDGSYRRSRSNRIPFHVATHLRVGDSGVIGALDPDDRFPYCRSSAASSGKHRDRLLALLPLAREVDQMFAYAVPDRWAQQNEMAKRTRPEWLVPGTCFTTITVNKNFQCGTHQDAGDYKPGFSNLVMIRSGEFTGGFLVLPQYRLAIELQNGDALYFDPHEWHGTSPFYGLPKRFERMTLVMYYRTNMVNCGSAREEISKARAIAQKADLERTGV
jgi:Oxygenase domain of the 2OGFeDO superfamily